MPDSISPGGALDIEAEKNWRRWEYCQQRGHIRYTHTAKRNENFWFGGSTSNPQGYRGDGQWEQEDAETLLDEGGRPSYTVNEIKPGILSAVGYQIHNRLDIQYKPRGGQSDMDKAAVRSKVAMQILDSQKFHWKETQVFADGLIEQRGYFDIRMGFDTNIYGDILIDVLDPRDVAPDPDAKSYEPDGWGDVTVSRWYTGDQIEQLWGPEARKMATAYTDTSSDYGDRTDESGARRNKFGDENSGLEVLDAYLDDGERVRRWRVIDRQRWVYKMVKVAVYPEGNVKPIANATPDMIAGYMQEGAVIQTRKQRQVQWTISTRWATIHNEISPYDRFTIIPYFCYFRRGRTAGKVDDAIDPQLILNKAMSSFVHLVNGTANSGWITEQNSLANMTPEELEQNGAKTGLHIEVKPGSKYPEKIQPNPVPPGVEKLIERAYMAVKNATVPDAMRGIEGTAISGVAKQADQFASQQELAVPLDNLTHTREMVADFITYLTQTFYTNERTFRITETDPRTGKEVSNVYSINRLDPTTGQFENDLTVGDYDTVIDSVPMQITFQNSQFIQALEMRKGGVNIPDRIIVKNSNLADKGEIIEAMDAQPQGDPLNEAKAALAQMQATLADANAAKIRLDALFASIAAGKEVALNPAIAPIADQLARSAGFKDQDAPPIVAQPPAGLPQGPAIPSNTDPLEPVDPASPLMGIRQGIEGGQQPGAMQ